MKALITEKGPHSKAPFPHVSPSGALDKLPKNHQDSINNRKTVSSFQLQKATLRGFGCPSIRSFICGSVEKLKKILNFLQLLAGQWPYFLFSFLFVSTKFHFRSYTFEIWYTVY